MYNTCSISATPVVYPTSVNLDDTPPLTLKAVKALAADWARKHGLTLADLYRWQWTPVIYRNRPALRFQTITGLRYRFLDNGKQRFAHAYGYKRCWYGLTDALTASVDDVTPFIICNGEGSTMAAQVYGLLAVCITSGEKGRIPDNLLDELKQKLAPGTKIIVAFDCDPTGRKTGPLLAAQLREAGYNARAVDLGLGDKGDLADFCMVHVSKAYERLLKCPELPQVELPKRSQTKPITPHKEKTAKLSLDAEDRRRAYFDKKWDEAVSDLERTTAARYMAAFKTACYLADLADTYRYKGEDDVRSAVEKACERNGYEADHGTHMVQKHIDNALKKPRSMLRVPDFQGKPVCRKPRRSMESTAPLSIIPSASTEIEAPRWLTAEEIFEGRKAYGVPVTAEFQYILGTITRGILPCIPYRDSADGFEGYLISKDDIRKAYEGDEIEGEPPAQTYTKMSEKKLLRKVPRELFDKMTLSISGNRGKTSKNSGRGRKCDVYAVASPQTYGRFLASPLARSLVAYQPTVLVQIDNGLKSLLRNALQRLQTWNADYTTITLGMIRSFLKSDDKYLAEAVFRAFQALPITDEALTEAMALLDDEDDQVESINPANLYGKLLDPHHFDEETLELIALKNQVLNRIYQTRLDNLSHGEIVQLPEGAPLTNRGWFDAFYNARMMPHHEGYLWQFEAHKIIGIDDKNTAKLALENAGVILEARHATRRFTVPDTFDAAPPLETVRAAALRIAKDLDKAQDGRPLYIRSFSRSGAEIGYADYRDNEPTQWRVDPAGYFEVEVQLRYCVIVTTPVVPASKQAIAEQTEETPGTEILEMNEAKPISVPRSPSSRRITPERLHDRLWMLRRMLAPFCFIGAYDMWRNPLNAEQLFETHDEAVDDLVDMLAPGLISALPETQQMRTSA